MAQQESFKPVRSTYESEISFYSHWRHKIILNLLEFQVVSITEQQTKMSRGKAEN